MHPNTRYRVRRARRVQLFLRTCALLGALGLLFCCIAINKTTTAIGWIIRVAPSVALVHTVYGISHLCRAAEGRTPASTASYMVFAAVVDTGLVPFFAFSAYLAYLDYSKNQYGWGTLFNDNVMSYKIIHAFFLLNATEAGLLVISLIMDVYLATSFRKISKLPPDMNPLEPNLTSRHHKRNKSSMNITEKHMSGSTLATKHESGLGVAGKRIPFIHTRTDSAESVTLYGNDSARNSRISMRKGMNENEMDPYRHSNTSFASSRVTLAPTRPTSAINPPANARTAGAGLDHRPERSSGLASSPARPSSWLSYLDFEGVPSQLSDAATEQLDKDVRPLSPVSAISSRSPSIDQQRKEQQNWYHGTNNVSQLDLKKHTTLAPPSFDTTPKKRSREPLGMNPPTPPVVRQEYYRQAEPQYYNENVNYNENMDYDPYAPGYYGTSPAPLQISGSRDALTTTDGNARASRPSSFIGSGGKSRFYGDLRASIGSISAEQRKMADDNVIEIYADNVSDDGYERTKTMQSASDYSGNIEVYGSDDDDEHVEQYAYYPQKLEIGTSPRQWNGERQVSNSTGNDLNTGYAGLGTEFGKGMARRREVSGKIVEEGRSPYTSPVREQKPVAAGWARFKGL